MKKNIVIAVIATSFLFYNSSCNRNTSANENNVESSGNQKKIIPEITLDEPFKNQPNNFCTIIRKLEITYYAPEKQVDDPAQYPEKYCLLDVCLDDPDNSSGIINIGDSIDMMNTYYQLIKVFDTEDEAKTYAYKYQIRDTGFDKE